MPKRKQNQGASKERPGENQQGQGGGQEKDKQYFSEIGRGGGQQDSGENQSNRSQ